MTDSKSVLLISPSFFDYEYRIKKALEEKGFKVFLYDDRFSNTSLTKILIRFFPSLVQKKISTYYKRIAQELNSVQLDYLIAINPEAMNNRSLDTLKKTLSLKHCIMYNWDSMKNKPRSKELIRCFDKVYTFDFEDSKKLMIGFLPLFFSDSAETKNDSKVIHDASFIGTIHSKRLKLINYILKTNQFEDGNVFLYFYVNSWIQLMINILKSPILVMKYRSRIFNKPLEYNEYLKHLNGSKYVIDIHHGKQEGLTMRTIELIGKQRCIITTNPRIKDYLIYKKSENAILVLEKNQTKDSIMGNTGKYDFSEVNKYHISNWLDNLLGFKKDKYLIED